MAAARQGRVVVVGSFNVDHVWDCDALPRAGETLAGRYRTGPGGKGFNQATAARRAGAETRFVCALGDDAGASLARELAARDGLVLVAKRSDEPTGTAGIFVDAQGRNCIVIGSGANASLDETAIEQAHDAIAGAAVVLAQVETPVASVKAALRSARRADAVTLLNPAPADAQVDAELLSLADILTPNETEFAGLCSRHLSVALEDAPLATMETDALHDLCRRLLPQGTVVVTMGAAGCFVSHAEAALRGDARSCYSTPAEAVEVLDTTGAGDAFNGAVAAALALVPEAPFHSHVSFAMRYAAVSVGRAGAAEGMPTREEVLVRFGEG